MRKKKDLWVKDLKKSGCETEKLYKRNKLKKLTENKGENKLRRKLRGKNIYKPRKRNEEQWENKDKRYEKR